MARDQARGSFARLCLRVGISPPERIFWTATSSARSAATRPVFSAATESELAVFPKDVCEPLIGQTVRALGEPLVSRLIGRRGERSSCFVFVVSFTGPAVVFLRLFYLLRFGATCFSCYNAEMFA